MTPARMRLTCVKAVPIDPPDASFVPVGSSTSFIGEKEDARLARDGDPGCRRHGAAGRGAADIRGRTERRGRPEGGLRHRREPAHRGGARSNRRHRRRARGQGRRRGPAWPGHRDRRRREARPAAQVARRADRRARGAARPGENRAVPRRGPVRLPAGQRRPRPRTCSAAAPCRARVSTKRVPRSASPTTP